MSVAERIMAELEIVPPGVPIAVSSLAERLQCSVDEVLAAGEELQQREAGDEALITLVKKMGDGGEEFYLSQLPLTLNDEPETR
jgi:hypothetical protein